MSEEKNEKEKQVRPQRQQWQPNILVQLLYRAWMVVFGVVKIALGAAATVVIILGMCMLAFAGALGDYLQNDIMPQAGMNLEEFSLDQSSFVYYTNSDGEIQLLQQLHTDTNRRWAKYEDIPQNMINATIAIEDKRFFEHQGVDWFTTIKAFANMFLGDDSKGGSTITQQLVKNLTQDDSVTVQRKLLEIFRATQFEQRYDKETVMEWYLNYIYLGNGCYGVRAAASAYFGKELEMLTTAECASLISITNNPSIYDPYGSSWMWSYGDEEPRIMSGAERNNVRKEWTLGEMVTQGWITREEYEAAMEQKLVFKSGIADGDRLTTCTNESCGYKNIASAFSSNGSGYFCPVCGSQVSVVEDASKDVYSWFVDTVLEDVAKILVERDGLEWSTGAGGTRTVYVDLIARSGYHIYTTLDMDVQNEVDRIYTDIDQIPDTRSGQQLQSATVVIDNATGDIVAMAGGVGEKDIHDAWNIATDARLQTGSSIKPLTVYAPAFETGTITPATVIKDLPLYYEGRYPYPYNDNRMYSVSRTVQTGVKRSVNCVAANLLMTIGTDYSFNFGKENFGLRGLIESYEASDGRIMSDNTVAGLAMGAQTFGISVRDMSCAYATFANNGVYREGRTFTKVFDSDGKLVIDNVQKSRRILSEKTVDYMNMCLFYATTSGTGTEADLSKHYVGGKTGTTNDAKDRWYCGFTKYYTAAVWTGYNTPERIYPIGCNNPAAVLWNKFMEPIHEDLEPVRIYDKSKFVSVDICLESGLLATDACRKDVRTDDDCSRVDTVYVYREDRPTQTCDKHVMMEFCPVSGAVANEWCKHFASEEVVDASQRLTLKEMGVCKVTREELDEMLKAEKHGLWDEFLKDEWVYLVDNKGRDVNSYQGLHGNLKQNVDAPYVVCTEHTEESWNAYLQSLIPEETEPPVDPNAPTDPTAPEQQAPTP